MTIKLFSLSLSLTCNDGYISSFHGLNDLIIGITKITMRRNYSALFYIVIITKPYTNLNSVSTNLAQWKRSQNIVNVKQSCSDVDTLQWRHNGYDSILNRRRLDCWHNRLLRHRSKKTSKLCVTGLCGGNLPVTDAFPAQRASNAENFPFDDVIMTECWRSESSH